MIMPPCCTDLDITYLDLIYPERLEEKGKEFAKAHGIDKIPIRELLKDCLDLGNGRVKIYHKCNQLDENGRCKIYETRPQVCKEYLNGCRDDCVKCPYYQQCTNKK